MKTFYLDGRNMKKNFHPYLKEALELPGYYGENLDALYDCLCEMPEILIRIKCWKQADRSLMEVFCDAQEENPGLQLALEE